MRCFFIIFGWLSLYSTLCVGQVKQVYTGTSTLIRESGGVESFEYIWKDSIRIPHGFYSFKKNQEEEALHELILIKSNFAQGLPHGSFELDYYTFRFSIVDFDHSGIKTITIGAKVIIQGAYDRGIPKGRWSIHMSRLEDSTELQQMSYDYTARTWKVVRDSIQIIGEVDSLGRFNGDWKFEIGKQDELQFKYLAGLLTEIKRGDESLYTDDFDWENQLLNGLNMSFIEPSVDPWIWQPGFEPDHPILKEQMSVAKALGHSFDAYVEINNLLTLDPLFSLPPMLGTSRIYHRIDESVAESLATVAPVIATRDSLLEDWLTLPVFVLRRSTNPICDSLMTLGESLQNKGLILIESIDYFLSEEARMISPHQMNLLGHGGFNSHRRIAADLMAYNERLEKEYQSLALALAEKQEILRLRGTLEELEEEWLLLYREIVDLRESIDESPLANLIFDRFIQSDFQQRQAHYGQDLPLMGRQDFLKETISYYMFYLAYFKTESYRDLTDFDVFITDAYTQFLYNPYMGEYNVEVLVKKRFLQSILTHYWPYKLDSIAHCEDGSAYRRYHSELMNIRQFLTDYTLHKGNAAKRLERRVRRSDDPKEIEALLREYMIEHWDE